MRILKLLHIIVLLLISWFIVNQYQANKLLWLAEEKLKRGEFQEAISILNQASELDFTEPRIFFRLGSPHLRVIAPYFDYKREESNEK
jgi:hypothetical protein